MSHINIKRTHPNLHRTIFACSLVYFSIGLLALYSPPKNVLGVVLSAAFIVIGAIKLYALHFLPYKWLQRVQAVGLTYSLFYAIIFVISLGFSITKPEVRAIAWLFPTWLFWTFLQVMTIIEPPVNPVSERTELSNGK